MRVQYGGYGLLSIYCPLYGLEDRAQQRLKTLEFVVAEMEQALPIVREMIRQMKGA